MRSSITNIASKLIKPRVGYNNPVLKDLLNTVSPGFSNIYSRHLSTSNRNDLIDYTHMTEISGDDLEKTASCLAKKIKINPRLPITRINLQDSQVMQTSLHDVELTESDRFGQILLASQEDILVHYGDTGISPSENVTPRDLLKYKFIVPKNSFGVLDIKNHTPFLIETKDATQSFALGASKLLNVVKYDLEEIKSRGSMTSIELPESVSRMIHIKLQERIFSDRTNERFYQEMTAIADKPTESNTNSGTLMNFERLKFGIDNSTDLHYHPGDRRLHIFTIAKEAGVTLNFCGIAENPDKRKDCELRLDFPVNSMVVLKFPAYTHHKFHGDFACMSVHTMEGKNILNAVKMGTLPKGFLESATVFSPKDNQDNWKMSIPNSDRKTSVDNTR